MFPQALIRTPWSTVMIELGQSFPTAFHHLLACLQVGWHLAAAAAAVAASVPLCSLQPHSPRAPACEAPRLLPTAAAACRQQDVELSVLEAFVDGFNLQELNTKISAVQRVSAAKLKQQRANLANAAAAAAAAAVGSTGTGLQPEGKGGLLQGRASVRVADFAHSAFANRAGRHQSITARLGAAASTPGNLHLGRSMPSFAGGALTARPSLVVPGERGLSMLRGAKAGPRRGLVQFAGAEAGTQEHAIVSRHSSASAGHPEAAGAARRWGAITTAHILSKPAAAAAAPDVEAQEAQETAGPPGNTGLHTRWAAGAGGWPVGWLRQVLGRLQGRAGVLCRQGGGAPGARMRGRGRGATPARGPPCTARNSPV